MDDDNDPSNWILVEKMDCFVENKNEPATSNIAIQESDHESDSSISIISEFPNDSFSEEDTLPCTINKNIKHDITKHLIKNEEEFAMNRVLEGQDENNQIKDDDVSSNSEISVKQWTFVDDKSKLQLNIKEKPFFLDCSQEPILEISDIDTESTSGGLECKALLKQEARHMSIDQFSLSRYGMFFFTFLCISILINFYVDHTDTNYYPTSPIVDNVPTTDKDVVKSCIQKQKTKTTADGFIEKCVIKHLNKKKKDIIKDIKLYLDINRWILEKKIKGKENEVFKKWRKRIYNDNLKKEYFKMKKEIKNNKISTGNKKTKRKYLYVNNSSSDEFKKTQVNQKLKNEKLNHKVTAGKLNKGKKYNKHFKEKREHTQDNIHDEADLKDKFKQIFSKASLKNKKTAEWYVKYDPVENDLKIINITNISNEDFILIRNDNKTLNGLWYFNLYGLSRPNIRKMGIDSHMINEFRKHNKAKWYFEYMTARDDYRHFYSGVYDF